jgi:hypothetical protein
MVIECFYCKENIPPEQFFDTCHSYWSELNVLKCACPYCGEISEIQIENGIIWFGYIYAAGTAHFAAVEPVHIDGLCVQHSSDSISIEFEGKEWIIGQTAIRRA